MSDSDNKKPETGAKPAEADAKKAAPAEEAAAVPEPARGEAPPPAGGAMPTPGDVVEEYLWAEVVQNEKSFKMGVILFAVLILIVIAYFTWMRSMLKEILQPQSIARTVVSTIETQLPAATKAFQDGVTKAMPQLVTFVSEEVVNRGIPQMGKEGTKYLDQHAQATAEFTSGAGSEVFRSLLQDYKKQQGGKTLEGGAEGPQTDDQLAAGLEATVTENLRTKLDAKLEDSKDTEDRESAAYKLHRSRNALRNIDHKLNELADSENPNRKQQMHKRIIGAWWGWVKKRGAGAGPGPADAKSEPALFDEGATEK